MSPDADIKPKLVDSQRDLSSPNHKGARANPSPNTKNSPKPKTKTKRSTGGSNGEWTPEKRERLIEILLAAGIKVLNMDDLAREVRVELGLPGVTHHHPPLWSTLGGTAWW